MQQGHSTVPYVARPVRTLFVYVRLEQPVAHFAFLAEELVQHALVREESRQSYKDGLTGELSDKAEPEQPRYHAAYHAEQERQDKHRPKKTKRDFQQRAGGGVVCDSVHRGNQCGRCNLSQKIGLVLSRGC